MVVELVKGVVVEVVTKVAEVVEGVEVELVEGVEAEVVTEVAEVVYFQPLVAVVF